jgi:NADPH:quinone reductase-like Zn-dependent oxidoreductase
MAQPRTRPHDLIVEVRAAGVNRADLSHSKGAYGRASFGDSDLGPNGPGDCRRRHRPWQRSAGVSLRATGSWASLEEADTRERARIDYRMAMRIPESLDCGHAAAISLLMAGWPFPRSFATAEELPISTTRTNTCMKTRIEVWPSAFVFPLGMPSIPQGPGT